MLHASAEDTQLFVRLLHRDHQGVARALRQRRAPVDSLVDTASAHGLSVVLLRALDGSPLRDVLDAAQVARLEQGRQRQETRSRVLLDVLGSLAGRFAAADQRFMLLKGPYLAQRYYGDVNGREFVDLDLLVPRADRARVFRLLGECGFAPRSRTFLGVDLTCFFVHGFDFTDGAAQVDLHWCLSRNPSLHIGEDAMWERAQRYPVAGRSYDVLADEDEILFAALSLLRDLERGRPKLKNILDLLAILEVADPGIGWQALFDRRRGEGVVGPLVNALGLCLDVAQAHDLAPRLSAVLAAHAGRRVPHRASDSPLVFRPRALHLGNRLWCARAYDTSVLASLAWWGVSLPFRVAVHRRRKS